MYVRAICNAVEANLALVPKLHVEECHPFAAAGTNFGHSINLKVAPPIDGIRPLLGQVEYGLPLHSRRPRDHYREPIHRRDGGHSAVFMPTVVRHDQFAPGYHVVLDTGSVVTVRCDQVSGWLDYC